MKPEVRFFAGLFFVQTAMMLGMAIIPFFVKDHLGGSDRAVTLAYGTQNVAIAAVCLISALFLPRVKNSALWAFIGCLGFGVLYTACVFCRTPMQYYIGGVLAMIFLGIAWPAMMAWLGGQPDEKLRARSFSIANMVMGIGLIVGALLVVLYQQDYRWAFAGVGILAALGTYAIYTLPHERDYFGVRPDEAEDSDFTDADRARAQANETHVYCVWLAGFAAWGLVAATRTVYPGHIKNLFEAGSMVTLSANWPLHVFAVGGSIEDKTLYSWMQAVLSLAFPITALLMARTTYWQRRFWLLALIQVATAGALVLLAGSSSLIVLLFCHLIFGVNTAYCNVAAQLYSVANPKRKHQRSAFTQGLFSLSNLVVPLAIVQAGVERGPMMPFRLMPVLMIVVIGVEAMLLLYGRRQARLGVATAHRHN